MGLRWGAPRDPAAQWATEETKVEVYQDGRVFLDGDYVFFIDRAGRVYKKLSPDAEEQPYVLLQPDGRLIGRNDAPWGAVTIQQAWLKPGSPPWIHIEPAGDVLYYDEEGEPQSAGKWNGCNLTARTQQTCTLVTHLFRAEIKVSENRDQARMNMQIQRSMQR